MFFFFFHSERPGAAAWHEQAWHHHQVHRDGQEGGWKTAQKEGTGQEGNVDKSMEGNLWKKHHNARWKEVVWRKKKESKRLKSLLLPQFLPQKFARFSLIFTDFKVIFSLWTFGISSLSPTIFFSFWICLSCSHHKFPLFFFSFLSRVHTQEWNAEAHTCSPATYTKLKTSFCLLV